MNPAQRGQRIGNYILDEVIGQGTFGTVWKAHHHVFQETVAVKIPTDPQYVRNLRREGVAIHGLRHTNIVRARDLDPYGDPPYLIMEFVDGPDLGQVIAAYPQGIGADHTTTILRGVLEALATAHAAGVIHRDLKPANILLANARETLDGLTTADVKVADFGLGRLTGMTSASVMHSGDRQDGPGLSGTIAYMAPEQRDGLEIDHRCDLFACGMILFEMLTGQRPQGSDRPSELKPGIPDRFDDIFERCYTRLERRFASAQEVLAALGDRQATAGASPTSHSPGGGCPRCGGAVAGQDQFCIHCGVQLVAAIRRCPQCQGFPHPHDQFCILCGTAVGASGASGSRA